VHERRTQSHPRVGDFEFTVDWVKRLGKEISHVRNVVPPSVSIAACSSRLARPPSVANLSLEHGPATRVGSATETDTQHASCPIHRRQAQGCYQKTCLTCLSAVVSVLAARTFLVVGVGRKRSSFPAPPANRCNAEKNDLPHLPRLRRCGGLAMRRRGVPWRLAANPKFS